MSRARILFAGFGASFLAALVLAAALRGKEAPAPAPEAALPAPAPAVEPVVTAAPPAPRAAGDSIEAPPPEPPKLETLEATLRSDASFREKADALKTAIKTKADPTLRAFETVLQDQNASRDLREVALRLLIEGAARSEPARRHLLAYASSRGAEDPYRGPALHSVLRYGGDTEVAACADLVFRETESEAVANAARALSGNQASGAQSLLQSLVTSHPSADARHRAEEERSGQYCEDHRPQTEE